MLKGFRNEPYFPNRVRVIVSDFGVTAAIIAMTLLDFYLGLDTPKLQVRSLYETSTNQFKTFSWVE